MGRIKIDSIRKNIFIDKKLYTKTREIASDMGLTYPDYIRHLLVADVIRRSEPPKNELELSKNSELLFMNTKKRSELIKIMHKIRELL